MPREPRTPLQAVRAGQAVARIASAIERRKVHRALDEAWNAATQADLQVTGYSLLLCLRDPQTGKTYTATRHGGGDDFTMAGILLAMATGLAQERMDAQGGPPDIPDPSLPETG